MALTKGCRLNKDDFKRIFENGKTVRNSFFFIKVFKNNLGHLRLAVVVPNKVSGKATTRNKIKRTVSGIFKGTKAYSEPLDMIVVATENIVGKTSKEIKREIEQTIDKFFVKHL